MHCKYCRKDFVGPIPLGLHLWGKRGRGRCPTSEEMQKQGWFQYHDQWLTSKPEWVEREEQEEDRHAHP